MTLQEPQSKYVKLSTYPKCPVCNMRWYQQTENGSLDITCQGCKSVWQLTKGGKCNET